jgi:hypothetical protein
MVAKFGQARREAFLAALRETGNQTIAAERAKVSRSWVHLHRSTDPEFRRLSDEAIAAFAGGPSTGSGRTANRPPSGWGFLDGAELVVRGTGGAGGGKRVPIARARVKEWSPRVEERFLATLAATCNVKAALAEVGMSAASAYNHRKRWRGFAERWDAAVEEGHMRLEAGLLEHGCNVFSGGSEAGPEGLRPGELALTPPMTVEQAIHLLHMHKHKVHGLGKAPGKRWRPPPTLEELAPGIIRKWNIWLAAGELGEEARARDEAEWSRRRGSGQARRRG